MIPSYCASADSVRIFENNPLIFGATASDLLNTSIGSGLGGDDETAGIGDCGGSGLGAAGLSMS
jgi:hypothetical protein